MTSNQPREGVPPGTGGPWEAIQTTRHGREPHTVVMFGGHITQDDAVEALVKYFEDKIGQSAWLSTKQGWERGITEIRRNKRTSLFSVTYTVRQKPAQTPDDSDTAQTLTDRTH